MTVVQFPRQYRAPLPDDAFPRGRERHAIVFPMDGKWAFMEMDEGGGSLVSGLTKHQALQSAVELAMEYGGTFELQNGSIDDEPRGVSA